MSTRLAAGGFSVEVAAVDDDLAAPRIEVAVPPDFTLMQREAPDLALAWRLAARRLFTAAFARGYRVVDFQLDRHTGGGRYLLAATD